MGEDNIISTHQKDDERPRSTEATEPKVIQGPLLPLDSTSSEPSATDAIPNLTQL